MNANAIAIKGRVEIILNGKIIRDIDNLVTTVGFSFLASLFGGASPTAMTFIAVGTGSTAPVVGDITLQTEIIRAAAAISVLTGADSNKVVAEKYFSPGEIVATVTEAGMLNAATAGSLFNRTVFTGVVVSAVDTFAVRWTISFVGV